MAGLVSAQSSAHCALCYAALRAAASHALPTGHVLTYCSSASMTSSRHSAATATDWPKTPNIDRLAARGLRFELAYCNQAVCAPRGITCCWAVGRRRSAFTVSAQNFRVAVPDAVTMTQHFMDHGWRAEAVGKVLHSGMAITTTSHHGACRRRSKRWLSISIRRTLPVDSSRARKRCSRTRSSAKSIRCPAAPPGRNWMSPTMPTSTGVLPTKVSVDCKRGRTKDTPFFLALGFVKPHLPLAAPKQYWDMHDPQAFQPARGHTIKKGVLIAGKRGGEIVNYEPL